MFKVNDYIVCGGNGVCKVVDIGVPNIRTGGVKREYYKLQAIYENGGTVYIPVDNEKVIMRKVMSKDEANELISSMPSIETFNLDDEKICEVKYREVMQKYDCEEWVKIIKTLYIRRDGRLLEGKKSIALDVKYLKMAEDYLFGELAISLDMSKESVKELVVSEIESNIAN